MRIIGIAGWSGSGKTTLLGKVIPQLVARGLKVSTLKHAHHKFDIDQPGKDSYAHRAAGATEVLISSERRFALMHELRGAPEPTLRDLLPRLSPVDLVIVEGYKTTVKGHLQDGDGNVTVEAEGLFILPRWARELIAEREAKPDRFE